MIYYRVAIQTHQSSTWQWRSTILTSLEAVFGFLRIYGHIPRERIRVFYSSSAQAMDEMLARENQGLASNSLSTDELLRGKSIRSEETAPASNNPAHSCPSCLQETAESIPEADPARQPGEGTALTSPVTQSLSGRSANWLEMRRLEVELGPAGDHDTPYRFTLPTFMPQTLAWMQLLVKVHSGELEP